VITEWISWPWVFYINISIELLVLALRPGLLALIVGWVATVVAVGGEARGRAVRAQRRPGAG
jgi:hypothetical protein